MQAKDFLTVAQHLTTQTDEASHRSAMSRAYYALYNQLYKEVSAVHAVPAGHTGHQAVSDCVAKCKHIDLQQVAHKLISLKSERIRADYKLGTAIARADAETCVLKAQKAFDTLDKFAPPDLQKQIRDAGI